MSDLNAADSGVNSAVTSAATSRAHGPLTVAIVGCGIIGVNHARAIALHPDLSITGLVDTVPAMADSLARVVVDELGKPRPQVFASLPQALTALHPDLVVICTPSGLHVQLAEEAVAAGANVVIEKPLDVTMPRARRLAELADEAENCGRVVSVISQHRFDPSSVAVAEAVRTGGFGRITSGVASVAWWRTQQYYDSGEWRGTWELDGGGAVMNQGVHTVDLLVWFLGQPVEVFAHTARLAHERIDVEDVAVATITFESGALAVLHATTAAYPGLTVRLQVHGSLGSAIIDNDQLEYFHAVGSAGGGAGAAGAGAGGAAGAGAGGAGVAGGVESADGGLDAFAIGHYRQYVDVVEAIREHRRPGVRVADALLSLAVVRAVYLSATLGRAIPVDAVLRGDFDDVEVRTEGLAPAGGGVTVSTGSAGASSRPGAAEERAS